jgi:hypothetical protein
MEHRWGERIAVDIPVRLTARPFAVRAARITNLSLSGAFIRVGSEARVLSRVQVVIEMPLRFKHATPVLSAYVARKCKDGIGIEWCDMAPRAVVELLRAAPPRRPKQPWLETGAVAVVDAASIPILRHGT